MGVQINVVGQYNGQELERAQRQLEAIRKEAEKAGGGVGGALQSAGKHIESFGAKTAATGDKVTKGVTLPVVGAGLAFLKMSGDLNKGMANVGALGVATDRVNELKAGVEDLAVEVGTSTGDLSDGLYNVVSAFGDTSDSLDILKANAKAARAGLATTSDAIALTSAVTKGYGDTSAAAVQKASDLALQTVKLGQTTFPELASSIGKVVPLTSALGVSQEELFGTMATFTGVTGGAAEVSTQLRGVMQGLMQPTGDMTGLMKKLGVESGEAMIEQFGLQETMSLIAKEAERSGKPLGKFLGSIEAQTLVLAATGGQADAYTQKLLDMEGALGATQEAYVAQTEGVNKLGFQMEQARERALKMGRGLGDTLAPAMLDVFDAAAPLIAKIEEGVTWFTSLDETQQRNILKWVAMAAAMGPVLSITGRLLKPVGKLVGGLGKTASGVGNLGKAFGKNASDAPRWANVVAKSTKAVGRGVAGAGRAAMSATGAIGRGMAAAGRATVHAAATVVRSVATMIVQFVRWSAQALVHSAKVVVGWARTGAAAVKNVAIQSVQVARAVGRYAVMGAQALAHGARVAAGWALTGAAAVRNVALASVQIGRMVARYAWMGVQSLLHAGKVAASWLVAMGPIGWAIAAVAGLVAAVIANWDKVKAATGAAWSWVTDKIAAVVEWIKGVPGKISAALVGSWQFYMDMVTALGDFVIDRLSDLVGFVARLPARIGRAASGMWDGVKDSFRGAINWIIARWNALQLRIGGQKVDLPLGQSFSIPSITLDTPNIPQLAAGAVVRARPGGTLANIGEGRADEVVLPLPRGWRQGRSGPLGATTVNLTVNVDARGADASAVGAIRQAAREAAEAVVDRVVAELAAGAGAA